MEKSKIPACRQVGKNQKSKLQIKIKNFGFGVPTKAGRVILIFAFCILNFIGCATIIEGAKGFAGISTKALEKARKDAVIMTFNYDYFTCYTKTLDILKLTDAYIYAQDIKKHMIAIYVSEADTTPVGIFFKEIDAANTQVEVSSPSTYAKELIATRIFKLFNPEK